MFPFDPPEDPNQGGQKGTLGSKGLIYSKNNLFTMIESSNDELSNDGSSAAIVLLG